MLIKINGEEYKLTKATSVANLLAELKLDPTKVAIERNLAIVSINNYNSVELCEGDNIEIVHFIGGG